MSDISKARLGADIAQRERTIRMDPRRRRNYREDDLRHPPAQVMSGASWWELPWPTHEPRVRLDIQTAVYIASTSETPLGMVELLTDSEPVSLAAHDWPVMPAESLVTASDRWSAELIKHVRIGRQARQRDWPAFERRRENNEAILTLDRQRTLLTMAIWIAGSLSVVCALASLVRSVW